MPDDVGAIVYYGFTTTDGMFTNFIFLNHGSGVRSTDTW